MLCLMRLTQNQKLNKLSIVAWSCCGSMVMVIFVVFIASRFLYVILCPNVMTMQTSKAKALHT